IKLGFISPNLSGHLNPMTALARHLQARNHEVVFLYSKEANGLPFVPGPEKDHIKENRTEQSKRQGEDALRSGIRQVLAQTEMILKSIAPNGADKWCRCPFARYRSILCRIGADAARHTLCTGFKWIALRLLRLYSTLRIRLGS